MSPRFFIGTDCSGHDYYIPLDKRQDWHDWSEIPGDDERAWDVPEYATYIDGGILTFSEPEIIR
jgi:hypothetical protein